MKKVVHIICFAQPSQALGCLKFGQQLQALVIAASATTRMTEKQQWLMLMVHAQSVSDAACH